MCVPVLECHTAELHPGVEPCPTARHLTNGRGSTAEEKCIILRSIRSINPPPPSQSRRCTISHTEHGIPFFSIILTMIIIMIFVIPQFKGRLDPLRQCTVDLFFR